MPDRHNPFDGVTDLFTELSRMREIGTHGREHSHEDKQRTHASAWVPTTDIFAQGGRLVIRIELAGVDPRGRRPALRQRGADRLRHPQRRLRRRDDEPTFYVRERFYGEFRRSITLPEGTEREQIHAGFDDGLVEIIVEGIGGRSDATRIQLRDRSSAATTRGVS